MLKFPLEEFVKQYTAQNINLLEVLSKFPKLGEDKGRWLAGGSLLRLVKNENLMQGDLDFFFSGSSRRCRFEDYLFDGGHKCISSTHNSTRWSTEPINANVISRYYTNIEECLNSFDFTICQLATDGYWLYATEQGWNDIKTETLRDTQIFLDGTRVFKYIIRGYMPSNPHLWEWWSAIAKYPITKGDDFWTLEEFKVGIGQS